MKIPATLEGLPAIEAMIAEGRSINVTLIFSLERYGEVIEAYMSGLEELVASGGDASKVASVASFFVSRVDTEVDRRLEQIAKEQPGSTRGRARPRAARHGRRRPGAAGLQGLPGAVLRTALGGAGAPGGPAATAAVGVDVDEEPGLSRPRLRRLPRRPRPRSTRCPRRPSSSSSTTARSRP